MKSFSGIPPWAEPPKPDFWLNAVFSSGHASVGGYSAFDIASTVTSNTGSPTLSQPTDYDPSNVGTYTPTSGQFSTLGSGGWGDYDPPPASPKAMDDPPASAPRRRFLTRTMTYTASTITSFVDTLVPTASFTLSGGHSGTISRWQITRTPGSGGPTWEEVVESSFSESWKQVVQGSNNTHYESSTSLMYLITEAVTYPNVTFDVRTIKSNVTWFENFKNTAHQKNYVPDQAGYDQYYYRTYIVLSDEYIIGNAVEDAYACATDYGEWPTASQIPEGESFPLDPYQLPTASKSFQYGAAFVDEVEADFFYFWKSKWRVEHQPSATNYLKIWLRLRVEDLRTGDRTYESMPAYVWQGSGNPSLNDASEPWSARANYVFGATKILEAAAYNTMVAVEIFKWSMLPDYEPDDPNEDLSRPVPDLRPNGLPT